VQRILNNWFVKWVLAPVAVLWALGWGYFQINYPTCTFRYKLTAEVMTPEGVKSGSSVIEVSYSSTNPIPNPGRWRLDRLSGEAVFIDLDGGKNLFVTLGNYESGRPSRGWTLPYPGGHLNTQNQSDDKFDYSKMNGAISALWLPIKFYKLGRTPGQEREMAKRASKMRGASPIDVPLINLPTVVTFNNLKDPSSIQVVDVKNSSKTLGNGYEIKRVSIELTNDDITRRIKNVLPWLTQYPEPTVLRRLKSGDFSADQIANADENYG
jgi:hypothetical protein